MKLISPEYRIALGTFIIINALAMAWTDLLSNYKLNESVVIALIALGSTLTAIGIVEKIQLKKKTNGTAPKASDEPS